ncbi:DUF6232 family protein [Streptomyces sp. H27-H1]|uniref:DUF6232 family protein n=1 Tax=Streptomyces sp. H27-H1 TaxID=2996461 RepID=UPI002270736F|nr:DUF6232 family protein [Streptomyces sp. H27-H1]MCY0931679.1 DUF6232 family protein [Streptomyces sp. H27-H1]
MYGVDLRISRRLLWVGSAAYPLHDIVRVHTSVLSPDRGKAAVQFLKWAAALAVVFYLLQEFVIDDSSSSYGDYGGYGSYEDDSASQGEVLGALAIIAAISLAVYLVYKLSRPDLHVMAVEVASASIALVTMRDESQLGVVVQHVVHAIEHPEAEFSIRMERVQVNLKSYHLGDSVNIYGGVGNTGVVKS